MNHFATPLGSFSAAEHELAAVIARESAISQILSLWSVSRPKRQEHVTLPHVLLASSFDR